MTEPRWKRLKGAKREAALLHLLAPIHPELWSSSVVTEMLTCITPRPAVNHGTLVTAIPMV